MGPDVYPDASDGHEAVPNRDGRRVRAVARRRTSGIGVSHEVKLSSGDFCAVDDAGPPLLDVELDPECVLAQSDALRRRSHGPPTLGHGRIPMPIADSNAISEPESLGGGHRTPKQDSGFARGATASSSAVLWIRSGWGSRIRTSAYGFRVRCPTTRRTPSDACEILPYALAISSQPSAISDQRSAILG